MKLSELKQHLATARDVNFIQPGGNFVPRHFHITEAGLTTKHFIDCGGTVRTEKTVNFQVWVADDVKHRLEPQKLNNIITTYEKIFGNEDLDVEVEYQNGTIGRYALQIEGDALQLLNKQTDCLAKEHCGAPVLETELQTTKSACCTPGGGCC